MATRAVIVGGQRGLATPSSAMHGGVAPSGARPGGLSLVAGASDLRGSDRTPQTKLTRKTPRHSFFTGPSAEVIVDLARAFIMAHIGGDLGGGRLAGATGVSESTLRRAVRAQAGLTLQQLVQNIRLDQAHAWLSTNRESRSQAEIAHALGWRSAGSCGRAYAQRFGETMSQTRRRAVMGGGLDGARSKYSAGLRGHTARNASVAIEEESVPPD